MFNKIIFVLLLIFMFVVFYFEVVVMENWGFIIFKCVLLSYLNKFGELMKLILVLVIVYEIVY